MKLFQAYCLLLFFSLTTTTIAILQSPRYAKPGCNDTCGNVRIPYPFGIGANCSVNKWYIVDCNSSTPYLSALNSLEILDVYLGNQTLTVYMPKYSDYQKPSSQMMSIDLGRSPFLFSKSHNKFVFEGCGNAVMMNNRRQVVAGCSTNCYNDTRSDPNNCFGIGCCQTTIPYYLKQYNISITGFERKDGDDRVPGSAYFVSENLHIPEDKRSYVSITLLWTLSRADIDQIGCDDSPAAKREVDMGNYDTMESWKCSNFDEYVSQRQRGNPYIYDGLTVVQEEGCRANPIYDPDGVITRWEFTCESNHNTKESKTSLGVILGISISVGVLFLVVAAYLLYKVIKNTKEKRQMKRFFKRNGGLLLKQQQEADSSLVGKTILFTSRELEKATDNFNENRILGRGGQGTVYKGMLVDGRIVAVKKSKIVDESQLEQFINEVVILSQVSHRNVVKLLGCCLETNVPLLVSEFIPNGTLYDCLHNETEEFPISLNMRLQIATEIAGALAYLHSASSIPIYHRDIKTTNILLDDKYRAKVSDFGTSRFVTIDQTHLTTLVKGTFGYLDPEYFQSSQFTEKSDVYSFGVVLVELLTRERPISLTRFGGNRSLATHFMLAMEEGRVMSIFDATVIKEATRNVLLEVANLAMRCLNLNGKYRPTMKEVAIELEAIRA